MGLRISSQQENILISNLRFCLGILGALTKVVSNATLSRIDDKLCLWLHGKYFS